MVSPVKLQPSASAAYNRLANRRLVGISTISLAMFLLAPSAGSGQSPKSGPAVSFPPKLASGTVATHRSEEFLKPTATLGKDVIIASVAPTVDFLYFPGQDYEGKPWSNWGDSLAVNGKYYASIGDHLAIGGKGDPKNGTGTAHVYEYDPDQKTFRHLVDVARLLNLPAGHYTPGKIHSRLDLGRDGCLYFATHRGSTTVTTDKNHYKGDWIIRCDPKSGKSEVVAHGPVPKHCIPTSVLDPDRLIFYGGTAPGSAADGSGIRFFAFDIARKKLLCDVPDGPARYMIFARSTGKVYYVPGREDGIGELMRFDPQTGAPPERIKAALGLRAATQETPQGFVYTISKGGKNQDSILYRFNTKTEEVTELGPASVGLSTYVTSIDADPTGRYLYYIPGAHGGSEKDGSPIVQFDTQTRRRKVIAFLHPFIKNQHGATLVGTFSSAIDPKGDKLYITWNVNRGGRSWDCCALTVIHIPESERRP